MRNFTVTAAGKEVSDFPMYPHQHSPQISLSSHSLSAALRSRRLKHCGNSLMSQDSLQQLDQKWTAFGCILILCHLPSAHQHLHTFGMLYKTPEFSSKQPVCNAHVCWCGTSMLVILLVMAEAPSRKL